MSAIVLSSKRTAEWSAAACDEDECRKYSKFTCEQLERQTYVAWFFFPSQDKEYNLGYVKGLKECQATAIRYANSKNMTRSSDNGGKDVFVHISAVERAGLQGLNEGQKISYEVQSERGKDAAVNLKV
jgi:cold shock CspA family protein